MKVLIVDDVGLIRRTLEHTIVRQGFKVQTADSGSSALEILKHDCSIGAVITDLHMPGISGIQLFSQVQGIERVSDCGVLPPPAFILLTADRDQTFLDFALQIGFFRVMQKPPHECDLVAALNEIQDALESSQPNLDAVGGTG